MAYGIMCNTCECDRASRTVVGRTWECKVWWRVVVHFDGNIESCRMNAMLEKSIRNGKKGTYH